MGESTIDRHASLDRFTAAAELINDIAATAGHLALGPEPDTLALEALTEAQAAQYHELVDARLDLPDGATLEEEGRTAAEALEEIEIMRQALFGPMTSPTVATGILAGMIERITGQEPSEDAIAAEVLGHLHLLEDRAANLQATIRQLGRATTFMAGGVNSSLLTAERRASIENDVQKSRRIAAAAQIRRPAEEEVIDRRATAAAVLFDSGQFPMTISELAEAVYGDVTDSTRVMAGKMAAEAAAGKGDLSEMLRTRGWKLEQVKVENPAAKAGGRGPKTLVAYITLPIQAED